MAIINISQSEFKDATSEGVVVVDFFATWCGPCKMLGPTFEKIANSYEGKAVFAKIDIDQNEELTREKNIMTVPTLLFYKDGAEVARLGVSTEAQIIKELDALL